LAFLFFGWRGRESIALLDFAALHPIYIFRFRK